MNHTFILGTLDKNLISFEIIMFWHKWISDRNQLWQEFWNNICFMPNKHCRSFWLIKKKQVKGKIYPDSVFDDDDDDDDVKV